MRRLDHVNDEVKGFFQPAAAMVLANTEPADALARALAAMSGLLDVPKQRRWAVHCSHAIGTQRALVGFDVNVESGIDWPDV